MQVTEIELVSDAAAAREKKRLYTRAWRAKRRQVGGCEACLEKAMPGERFCKKHMIQANKRDERRRERALQQGRCHDCAEGRPIAEGQKYRCKECAEAMRLARRRWLERQGIAGATGT